LEVIDDCEEMANIAQKINNYDIYDQLQPYAGEQAGIQLDTAGCSK